MSVPHPDFFYPVPVEPDSIASGLAGFSDFESANLGIAVEWPGLAEADWEAAAIAPVPGWLCPVLLEPRLPGAGMLSR